MTVKPGPVPGRGNALQAPHIAICVLSRGLMRGLVTRAYFQGEALNETDPLLMSIEDPARRGTLIAQPAGTPSGRRGGWISGCKATGRRCSWTYSFHWNDNTERGELRCLVRLRLRRR